MTDLPPTGTPTPAHPRRILVTGATGYVGGRLVPRLLAAGYQVRCLTRDPRRLAGRPAPWPRAERIAGDVLDPASLAPAMRDIDVAYYLVHSMAAGEAGFRERDRQAAAGFAAAAAAAGVGRIIYLGGLGRDDEALSEHLRSRHEVGEMLRAGPVPVTEFRAAIVVGSGSVSFEMIRYLTERLPVMTTPRWVNTPCQPISIRDLLTYLIAALEEPRSAGRVIEIGGSTVLTYGEMMQGYARVRGLHRVIIPVPVLTPGLSSHWVNLVTPIPRAIARSLIEGLRNPVVVRDPAARELFPQIRPMSYQDAVRQAVERLTLGHVETSWTMALGNLPAGIPLSTQTHAEEGLVFERREQVVDAPPALVYRVFTGIGGKRGWLYANWTWRLRGMADRVVGGVGLRRGRRDPNILLPGEALDWWRVEDVQPGRLLRLRAEMKLPGRGWLEFCAEPASAGRTLLRQTAYFHPTGLAGLLYWYGLYPIHRIIFQGMIRALARRAERLNTRLQVRGKASQPTPIAQQAPP
jgi:uncharacterized protein YbjT (DUF2867 family)/uncharacterized protein YndB with AHSA1/START domain